MQNASITVLNLQDNDIGDEGAKARWRSDVLGTLLCQIYPVLSFRPWQRLRGTMPAASPSTSKVILVLMPEPRFGACAVLRVSACLGIETCARPPSEARQELDAISGTSHAVQAA